MALSPDFTASDPVNCDELKVNLFQDVSTETSNIVNSVTAEKLATFLRIRPLENVCLEETPYKVIDSNLLCVDLEENNSVYNNSKKPPKRKFVNFTEIFDENASQKAIFSKCCLPLVNDVLEGTNALLFCYGTTSSGKSFTMRGPPDDPTSDPGLIPLSLKKIFTSRQFVNEPLIGKSKFCDIVLFDSEQQEAALQFKENILSSCRNVSAFSELEKTPHINEDGCQYICYISYFEIYNGLIYDLLIPSSGGRGTSLSVFPDESKRYFVKDLSSVMVSSLTEALQVYSFGWNNLQRNIQETGLNKNSSRSHSFLSISLIKFREDQGRLLDSQVSHLTLGDLAGSERQNKTHSEGMRVKEGGNINVSLMHLKECFTQTKLSQKNPKRNFVIPFRNSNLTKFFQPYLTGTGRVWMIININPSPSLLHETCGSLDLGETASHISVNSTYQKLEESKRRMTQMWLQSSQRWSSFACKSKVLDVPEIVIEEDTERQESPCDEGLLQKDQLANKYEIEEQVRKEVIEQFEEILSDIQKEHERDLQVTRDNYEKTMEARLALSDKKLQALQVKVDYLNNELFEARESSVHMEDKLKEVQQKAELSRQIIQDHITSKQELERELQELRLKLNKPSILTKDQEVITEQEIVPLEEFETTKKLYETKIYDLQIEAEKELEARLQKLRQDLTPPVIFKIEQETQTELTFISKEEVEAIKSSYELRLQENGEKADLELQLELEKLRKELKPPVVVKIDQDLQTESSFISSEELEAIKASYEMQLLEGAEKANSELQFQQNKLTHLQCEMDKLTNLQQELTKPIVSSFNQETQTVSTLIPIEELEALRKSYEDKIDEMEVTVKELGAKYDGLLLEMIRPSINQEVQTEYKFFSIEEVEAIKADNERKLKKVEDTAFQEMETVLEKYRQEVKKSPEKLVSTVFDETKTDSVPIESELSDWSKTCDEINSKVLDDKTSERQDNNLEIPTSDCSVFAPSPRKTRRSTRSRSTSNVTASVKKPSKEMEKCMMSAKKGPIEVTIDANYVPASVSGWAKKKKKEEAVPSPSTEITTEYLRRFGSPATGKKSARKKQLSVKKPPRKSTKKSLPTSTEEEEGVETKVIEAKIKEVIEDDEIAELLKSKKKGKKKAKDDEEVKIPTKRKRLPMNDEFLETAISPHFEDEPSQTQNTKTGRVLRPRRKIKF